jgi:hypothetical protein
MASVLARQALRTGRAAQTEEVEVEVLWAAARERRREIGRIERCMMIEDV